MLHNNQQSPQEFFSQLSNTDFNLRTKQYKESTWIFTFVFAAINMNNSSFSHLQAAALLNDVLQ